MHADGRFRWGARGQTPVVATDGRRQSIHAISAVNLLGAFWYNVYSGKLNKYTFVAFVKDFQKRRRRPVFLVVDRHPAHVAQTAAEFVQSLQGRLELQFLPGYAPDLNPDEFVWIHLRQKGSPKSRCGAASRSRRGSRPTWPASRPTRGWCGPFSARRV